jgi:hypothetical protein
MVDCGMAEKLDCEVMGDKEGNEVDDPKKMYGRPSRYHMLFLDWCVFVDETGWNTNQKTDGYCGAELFVVPVDQAENGRTGTTTDLHFTILPFISGTGEAIMCVVILKSKKPVSELPIKWIFGLDIMKNVESGENEVDMFENNFIEGKAMGGGPTCHYNGVDIPCFVCSLPKSSITTELLCEMLDFLDTLNVFPQDNPDLYPFLLLDGHQSRTKLEFLEYICDDNHKWCCCIGVPYGTHIWQAAHSLERNGCF